MRAELDPWIGHSPRLRARSTAKTGIAGLPCSAHRWRRDVGTAPRTRAYM